MTYKELKKELNNFQKETSSFLRSPTISRIRHYKFQRSFYHEIWKKYEQSIKEKIFTVYEINERTKIYITAQKIYNLINDTLVNLKYELRILSDELIFLHKWLN